MRPESFRISPRAERTAAFVVVLLVIAALVGRVVQRNRIPPGGHQIVFCSLDHEATILRVREAPPFLILSPYENTTVGPEGVSAREFRIDDRVDEHGLFTEERGYPWGGGSVFVVEPAPPSADGEPEGAPTLRQLFLVPTLDGMRAIARESIRTGEAPRGG